MDNETNINKSNTGNDNIGRLNTGFRNFGHGNTGWYNTGWYNTGNNNTGNCNTGNCNTGNWNTGNCNTGYSNSGHGNSGGWNTGNNNAGYFNCDTPSEIRCFGKMIPRDEWARARKPNWIFMVSPVTWIFSDDMTDDEKSDHPEHETIGGYLRKNEMHEEWAKAYATASPRDIQAIRDLPGFDADVFEKITGLRL